MIVRQETRKCCGCKIFKDIKEFAPRHVGSKYIRSYCTLCNRAVQKKSYNKHAEKRRAEQLNLYYTGGKREQHNIRKYGINEETYQNMLKECGGVCNICKMPETSVKKNTNEIRRLAIDHDHNTLAVRGLLCSTCNTGIGKLRDSIEILEAAILYLRRHKK